MFIFFYVLAYNSAFTQFQNLKVSYYFSLILSINAFTSASCKPAVFPSTSVQILILYETTIHYSLLIAITQKDELLHEFQILFLHLIFLLKYYIIFMLVLFLTEYCMKISLGQGVIPDRR